MPYQSVLLKKKKLQTVDDDCFIVNCVYMLRSMHFYRPVAELGDLCHLGLLILMFSVTLNEKSFSSKSNPLKRGICLGNTTT